MKIGIDLGGSHIGLGVINSDNNILENYEKDFTEEERYFTCYRKLYNKYGE